MHALHTVSSRLTMLRTTTITSVHAHCMCSGTGAMSNSRTPNSTPPTRSTPDGRWWQQGSHAIASHVRTHPRPNHNSHTAKPNGKLSGLVTLRVYGTATFASPNLYAATRLWLPPLPRTTAHTCRLQTAGQETAG